MNNFFQIASIVVAIGGVAWAFHLIWKHILYPLHKAILTLSQFVEAQPTLLQIAHEFQPNDGNTLRDQVDLLAFRLSNIESSVEQLVVNCGKHHT